MAKELFSHFPTDFRRCLGVKELFGLCQCDIRTILHTPLTTNSVGKVRTQATVLSGNCPPPQSACIRLLQASLSLMEYCQERRDMQTSRPFPGCCMKQMLKDYPLMKAFETLSCSAETLKAHWLWEENSWDKDLRDGVEKQEVLLKVLKSQSCRSMMIGQLEVGHLGWKVCLGEILLGFQHWRVSGQNFGLLVTGSTTENWKNLM